MRFAECDCAAQKKNTIFANQRAIGKESIATSDETNRVVFGGTKIMKFRAYEACSFCFALARAQTSRIRRRSVPNASEAIAAHVQQRVVFACNPPVVVVVVGRGRVSEER